MIKKLFATLSSDNNTFYFSEYCCNVVFSCSELGILNMDINNINLDNNFGERDPDTIILVRIFWISILNLKNAKHLKKTISEELMPTA